MSKQLLIATAAIILGGCSFGPDRVVHKVELTPCPSAWADCVCGKLQDVNEPKTLSGLKKQRYDLLDAHLCMKGCMELWEATYNACVEEL